MTSVALDRKDESVRRIADLIGYKGRKITARIQEKVSFYGTMWDEGNRRTYYAVNLSTMTAVQGDRETFAAWSPAHHTDHVIPPGFIVAVFVEARGREYMEIIAPASTLTPMLPAPVELTEDERKCLISTRSNKSTYAGNNQYRRTEAGMTVSAWETAKASLIARGFLNKAGAITITGRNAIGSEGY
jgi:hypothetical protein